MAVVNEFGGTILTVVDGTATKYSDVKQNLRHRGVIVTLNVSAVTDTPALTTAIEFYDPILKVWMALLTASAAVTSATKATYLVYPGVGSATGDITQVAGFPLPATWRVKVAHGDTDKASYTVTHQLLI